MPRFTFVPFVVELNYVNTGPYNADVDVELRVGVNTDSADDARTVFVGTPAELREWCNSVLRQLGELDSDG